MKNKFIKHLNDFWNISVSEIKGDSGTITCLVQGELVALASMPAQIPMADIQGTAQYSYKVG